jgi:hypothetical protein
VETQILEGTLTEVQQQMSALPLPPDTRLRVVVTDAGPSGVDELEPFVPSEYRNGVPLLPRRCLPELITLELVKRLSEDEEMLRAYRTAGR